MRQLLAEVRAALPFDLPAAAVCTGDCDACPLKLLQFLDTELTGWEARLDAGERPQLGDLSALAGTARAVRAALVRAEVIDDAARAFPHPAR